MRIMMNDTAIVTCFYTNLYGTKYGGRLGREAHYIHSLLSLLKITNADFIIYCDPSQKEMLQERVEPLNKTNVKIIGYSLDNFYMRDLFARYKNTEAAISSHRCQELQYLKTYWMNKLKGYDYVFWIDVGISYSGLIPDKHLIFQTEIEYFNSDLFCDDLINGMKKATQDKFLILAINNHFPTLYRFLIDAFYDKKLTEISHHTIGGILGGKKETIYRFQNMFSTLAEDVITNIKEVHDEECIYNILCDRNPDMFNVQTFDMWWHEDNLHSIYQDNIEKMEEVKHLKSFYNVLEDLVNLGKQP
jgi:hypothetical protein